MYDEMYDYVDSYRTISIVPTVENVLFLEREVISRLNVCKCMTAVRLYVYVKDCAHVNTLNDTLNAIQRMTVLRL